MDNTPLLRQDDSRRREDAAIRMEQRFDDFIEAYDKDKADTKEWRKGYDEKLTALNSKISILDRFDTPIKIMGGAAILMVTPILGVLGYDIGKSILHWMDKSIK